MENFVAKLESIERANELDTYVISGVNVWDLYRYKLQNAWDKTTFTHSKQSFNLIQMFLSVLTFCRRVVKFLPLRKYIIFLRHPRLARQASGLSKDLYSDDLINEVCMQKSCLIFDPPSICHRGANYLQKDTLPLSFNYAIAGLLFKIFKLFLFNKFSKNKEVLNFYKIILPLLPLQISYEAFTSNLFETIYKFKIHRLIWSLIFKIFNPEKLFITVSHGNEAIIDAARATGAPVIEIQHGSPTAGKLNYDYKSGISKTYVPDIFASFGGFMHTQLPVMPHVTLFPLGYPHLQKYKNKFQLPTVNIIKKILVLSQHKADQYISKWLSENREKLLNYEIEIRMHPSYNIESTSPFNHLPFKQTLSRDHDLYDHLQEFDAVIGCYSTALFEARDLGLEAHIIHTPWSKMTQQFVDKGHAAFLPQHLPNLHFDQINVRSRLKPIFQKYESKNLMDLLSK